ncbi:hypothetical protein BGZ76_009900 [Entomortierella beljakovae]|nr:hypothetical protein BGZ76_009900 [Entomortierella beljakovae]
MENIDPASLLLIQIDEYPPLQLDPSVFESVGLGVAPKSFTIHDFTPVPDVSPREPLDGLKALAEQLDPSHQEEEDAIASGNTKRIKINGNIVNSRKNTFVSMDNADSWNAAWELDLDQRVQSIDGSSIFDRLLDTEARSTQVPDGVSPTLKVNKSSQDVDGSMGQSSDRVGTENSPIAPSLASTPTIKNSVEISLELPPLGKRPRDIVEDCYFHEGVGLRRLPAISEENVPRLRSPTSSESNLQNISIYDTWRAAGRPSQQDTLTNMMEETAISEPLGSASRPDKAQLSWETCTEFGPKSSTDMPFVSPYITESGTQMFEAVYQRHVDYAFRFRPDTIIVPYKSLVGYTLLLLGGTPSLVFVFNQESMEFVMSKDYIRTEGCSTASISK